MPIVPTDSCAIQFQSEVNGIGSTDIVHFVGPAGQLVSWIDFDGIGQGGLTVSPASSILFANVIGNISINQMNSGIGASPSTFFRGDGTWQQVSFANIAGIASPVQIPNISGGKITSGLVATSVGGTGVDLSTSGSATGFLAQNASHIISTRSIASTDIPQLPASIIGSGQLALARGGTGVDLSSSGGTHQFLAMSGAQVISAVQPAFTDISGTATSTQYVVMVGDSGSGGVQGAVPAPPIGSAAAAEFLKADGTWAAPATAGITLETNSSVNSSQTVLNLESGTGIVANNPSGGVVTFTLQPSQAAVIGGVKSVTPVTSNWIDSISTAGAPHLSQPAFTDISGTAGTVQIPSLDASKITTGQLALARGGTGVDLSASGGSSNFLAINSSHVISAAQPAFTDISGTASSGQYVAMVGDSGSGGTQGAVPAPPAGSAAAGKFLKADGTFAVPPTAGITLENNGTPNSSQTLLNLFAGANVTITDSGAGKIVLNSSAGGGALAVDTNNSANSSQSVLSLNNGTGIVTANPTGGNVTFTLQPAQAATIGGVESLASVASNWIDSISTLGVPHASQPAFTDISGTAATGQIPNLAASKITSGTLALARGGTNADLSASGGTTAVLAQDASHVITARNLVAADIPALAASKITSGTLALAQGGTGVDLSASGAAHNFLAINGSHVISSAQPAFTDISGTATSAQYVVMVGDTGSGGVQGAAPAPGAGDAAASKFLKADATWAVPPGTGVTLQTNTVSNTSQTTLNLKNGTGIVLANPSAGNVTFTLQPSQAATIGGVESLAAVTSNWIDSISTLGVPHASQPAFSDISGTAATAQIPNLDASKITTGTIALSQGGTGVDLSASGGTSNFLAMNASHVISSAQPTLSDIAGTGNLLPTVAGVPNIGSVSLPFGQIFANQFIVPSGNSALLVGTETSGTPSPQLGNDILYLGDQTSHSAQLSNNGGSFQSIATWDTTSPTLHGVVIAGTFPAVHTSGPGTTGQVLTSNGAGSDPTFQSGPFVPTVSSSTQGKTLTNNGTTSAWSGPTLDCTQFSSAGDMSQAIQACTAALHTISTLYGVADARGFVGNQTWSVDPLGGTAPNGGILLLGGTTITQNVPVKKPRNWTIQGGPGSFPVPGQNGTEIQVSTGNWQTTYSTGTVTINGTGNLVVTGSGTAWTSKMQGCVLAAGSSITTGATSFGIINNVSSGTALTLYYNGAGVGVAAGTAYAIYCPQIVMGTGVDSNNEQGGGLESLDLNCLAVAGCINVVDYFAEEGSWLKYMSLRNSTNIGLDIEGGNGGYVQNGLTMWEVNVGSSTCSAGYIPVVYRNNSLPPRGWRGGDVGCSGNAVAVAVDGFGFSMEDIQLTGSTVGIEVGAQTHCPIACVSPPSDTRNSSFKNIWGGGPGGTTMIDLSSTSAVHSITLQDIVITPASGWTNELIDHATGCTETAPLALYVRSNAGKLSYSSTQTAGCYAGLQAASISTPSHLLISSTAPTIASGFGTSPSVTGSNGTTVFFVHVGTGGTASTGNITMPAATTSWICNVSPNTAPQAGAITYAEPVNATTVQLTNYTLATGIALAWTSGTILNVSCFAY